MKHTLSHRQVQIMRRLCRGLVAKEIALEMNISVATVRMHMIRARLRLRASNIIHAAALFSSSEPVIKSDI